MEGGDKFGVTSQGSRLADRLIGNRDIWTVGAERKSTLSSLTWNKTSDFLGLNGETSTQSISLLKNRASNSMEPILGGVDTSVFPSSLPELFHDKLNLLSSADQYVVLGGLHLNGERKEEQVGFLEEMKSHKLGDLLPDDEEELLAGIVDGLDYMNVQQTTEDSEEVDLFTSGGGLEMDGDSSQESFGLYMNNHSGLDNYSGSIATHGSSSAPGSVIGEHPYGEHPSRTLFVRNINSNVEDSEIHALFEQYGAIRTLYTVCKHRGFVMISYYDIRAARSAMRALQNKPLRRRKLDIHFSIPKDNPSDKDINQGTLVVFNLDPSVSNDDLRHIFGAYGEVKEIRETPHKRHHKFIEFYDVRAAEAALRSLNRSDIAGKRIKLEPSRPGGARRSLMQQLSQELEQEETSAYKQQASSPVTNSPPGLLSVWGNIGSPIENRSVRALHHSIGHGTLSPIVKKPVTAVSANLPHVASVRAGTVGSDLGRSSQVDPRYSVGPTIIGESHLTAHHPHSFPEYSDGFLPTYTPAAPVSVRGASPSHGTREGVEGICLLRTTSNAANAVSLFEHTPGVGAPTNGSFTHLSKGSGGSGSLSGPQFLWGNRSLYQHSMQNSPPVIWSTGIGHTFNPAGHAQPLSYGYTGTHGSFLATILPSHCHHAGSAPSGDPSIPERYLGYHGESPDTPFVGSGSLGPIGVLANNGGPVITRGGGRSVQTPGSVLGSNEGFESGIFSSMRIMSPGHRAHLFQTSGFPVSGLAEGIADRGRLRRSESNAAQADNKKQYQLDIDCIIQGEDTRTTLMIKNIPNKYTSKMLLAAIDENHRGTYDFLYLPIDFKNKCNVGYAFINMTAPQHIILFYQAFNGKKWEKFNSEKVATLAYARIQGKAALIAHFQNSSLMNEDKRCRPILFHSNGPDAGDQEAFPLGVNSCAAVNKEQNGSIDSLESPNNSSMKDESVSRSDGSSSGGMILYSPEKEQDLNFVRI